MWSRSSLLLLGAQTGALRIARQAARKRVLYSAHASLERRRAPVSTLSSCTFRIGGRRHAEMDVHERTARPRQRLLCVSAADGGLGLEQCRADRGFRPDTAGRYALRPEA